MKFKNIEEAERARKSLEVLDARIKKVQKSPYGVVIMLDSGDRVVEVKRDNPAEKGDYELIRNLALEILYNWRKEVRDHLTKLGVDFTPEEDSDESIQS